VEASICHNRSTSGSPNIVYITSALRRELGLCNHSPDSLKCRYDTSLPRSGLPDLTNRETHVLTKRSGRQRRKVEAILP